MTVAIVLSGGTGTRMGLEIPKQYINVHGQPIINYCLRTFLENKRIDALIIGVADSWKEFVIQSVSRLEPEKPIYYASPGETRQLSIYNALKALKEFNFDDHDIVIIHDAARPLLSTKLIDECLNACEHADAVLPVLPVKDTIYMSEDGKSIHSLLNRNTLWAGQAPEAFHLGTYLQIHEKMDHEELLRINGSTEIAFKAGLHCHLIPGDSMNFKITTIEDLHCFENIILSGK